MINFPPNLDYEEDLTQIANFPIVYNNRVAYAVNPDRTAVAKVHDEDVSERVDLRQASRLRRHEGIPAGDVLKLRQLRALRDHIEEQQQLNENAGVGNELNEILVVIEMEINYINLFVQSKINYRCDLTLQNRLTSSLTFVELYQWIGFTRAHLYQVGQLLQIPSIVQHLRQVTLGSCDSFAQLSVCDIQLQCVFVFSS